MKGIVLSWVTVSALSWTGVAGAGVIYSQAPIVPGDRGAYSEINGNGQQLADNFTLASAATVQAVRWYGSYDPSAPFPSGTIEFHIRFFADVGGAPAINPFFDTTVNATATSFAGAVRQFDSNIAPAALGAGTAWISIVESDITTVVNAAIWRWNPGSGPNQSFAIRFADATSWNPITDPVRGSEAFTLFDTPLGSQAVPEPSALLLTGLSSVGLVGWHRRSRRKRTG